MILNRMNKLNKITLWKYHLEMTLTVVLNYFSGLCNSFDT